MKLLAVEEVVALNAGEYKTIKEDNLPE